MKRILCAAFVGACMLAGVATAQAVDMKVSGQWDFAFGRHDNTGLVSDSGEDHGVAYQRIRNQVHFIASEQLQGVLQFEIGRMAWGRSAHGAQLDADGVNIKTRRAFIDWTVPHTDLSLRMGLQGLTLPNAVAGNPVFDADVAAIVGSYKFNDMVSLTAFWARPFDAAGTDPAGTRLRDEMDMFGFTLPITGDGWKVTPWGMYASIGGQSGYWGYMSDYWATGPAYPAGPYYGSTPGFNVQDGTSNAWWAAVSGEVSIFAPLSLKADFIYGNLDNEDVGDINSYGYMQAETSGWFVTAALDYKLDWGTPGLFGWYATGDDKGDAEDGKFGRLPVVGIDQTFYPTSFGFGGNQSIMDDTIISSTGVGTWGIGAQIANISFVDNLTHLVRVAYYKGTNDAGIVRDLHWNPSICGDHQYLTDKDHVWEVNVHSKYQVYENFAIFLELGYLRLDRDEDTWRGMRNMSDSENAWKQQILFQYKF